MLRQQEQANVRNGELPPYVFNGPLSLSVRLLFVAKALRQAG
jgi:hypothetical protein